MRYREADSVSILPKKAKCYMFRVTIFQQIFKYGKDVNLMDVSDEPDHWR